MKTSTFAFTLFATFALLCNGMFVPPEVATNKATTDDKNMKIGIIGGGPAGLYAARLLARAGYDKVTVLEGSDEVCDTIKTEIVDGKVHDFTTRFISGVTVNGPGMDANLAEMITDYGLETEPISTKTEYLQFLPPVDGQASPPINLALPHIFADFFAPGGAGPQGIIGDLAWGFELLRAVAASKTISACRVVVGGGNPLPAGITWDTWSQGINKPAFTRLASFTNDLFLGGPSTQQDVCHFLNIRTHFMISDIIDVLKSFGLNECSQIPISDALRELLNPGVDHRRRQIKTGFKSLFQALVDTEDFDFVASARVVSIEDASNGQKNVQTEDGKTYNFDRVVIATRPEQSVTFIPESHPSHPMMEQGWSTPVHVHAFHTTGSVCGKPTFTSVLYPNSAALGMSALPPGVVGLNKQYPDSDLVIAIGYATDNESDEDELARASGSITAVGLTPTESPFGYTFNYPSFISTYAIQNDWYVQMEGLQGNDQLYFIGEALSGYGIPAVLEYVKTHVETHFALAAQ